MSTENPIRFFQGTSPLLGDSRAVQIQLEMGQALNTVSMYAGEVEKMPHQLVALMEYTLDPQAREVTRKSLQMRLAVGLLHCDNPSLQIIAGRLFFKTHGYYEIPNIQKPEFFGTQIITGSMHPNWAQYYRLCMPISVSPNFYETQLAVMPSQQSNDPQLYPTEFSQLLFLRKNEIPALFKELTSHITVGGIQDVSTLNHQLQSLANHT